MRLQRKLLGYIIFIVVLALFPFFLNERFFIYLLTLSLMWGIVASNWDLLMGYCGIFSLAQMSFFIIGGYTSGMLVKYLGIDPFIGLLCAGLVTAGASTLLVGLPTLRLKGVYVALLTVAFNEILRIFILSFGPAGITGGIAGLVSIPPYSFGGRPFTLINNYYLILLLFSISLLATYSILDSRISLAFTALRESEAYAVSRGVNAYSTKVIVFLISCFFTGVAGAFYVHNFGTISVLQLADISVLFALFAMIIIGGWGRFPGAIIGSFIVTFLSEYVLHYIETYRLITLGLIEIVIIVLVPAGAIKILDVFRSRKTA
jgi:branched-chain amino acid transport system permease protein